MRLVYLVVLVLWVCISACNLRKCATRPPDVLVQLKFSGQDSSYLEPLNWELGTDDGEEFPYEIRNLSDSVESLFQVTLILVSESKTYYLAYGNTDVDTLMVFTHDETSGCTRTILDEVWMNGMVLSMNSDSSYFYQKRP